MPANSEASVTSDGFLTRVVTVMQGFCMGSADIVPGVSGGTVAVILGIYQRLLGAIANINIVWCRLVVSGQVKLAWQRSNADFLIPLLIGIVLALLFFTHVVPLPALIKSDPEPVYGLFFGLIMGSISLLLRETPVTGVRDLLFLGLGVVFGLMVVNMVPAETPETPLFVFFSGSIAISAMLMPGISGSFILLMLRKYAYVVDALGHLRFEVIIPFVLGCGVGVIIFSRVITFLLNTFYRQTMLIIIGVLTGSLWMIWPFQNRQFEVVRGKERLISSAPTVPDELTSQLFLPAVMLLVGFGLVLTLQAFSNRNQMKS